MTEPDVPPEDAPPPAFPDQTTVPLTKVVNLTQLADELRTALDKVVQIAQLGPDGDPYAPPSEDNPAELAISPADVDAAVVEQVITDHNPDEAYGVPKVEQDFTATMQAVVDDNQVALDEDQIQAAVRGLLLREAARRAP
jgi:hypothetical protein